MDCGALSADQRSQKLEEARDALKALAREQSEIGRTEKPTDIFISRLQSAIFGQKCHLTSKTRGYPENPSIWGWRKVDPTDQSKFSPCGPRIGFVVEDEVWLDPNQAFRMVRDAYQAEGNTFPLRERGLWRALEEAGLILRSESEGKNMPKRNVGGTSQRLLVLPRGKELLQMAPLYGVPPITPERQRGMGELVNLADLVRGSTDISRARANGSEGTGEGEGECK